MLRIYDESEKDNDFFLNNFKTSSSDYNVIVICLMTLKTKPRLSTTRIRF